MAELKREILEHIGVISTNDKGWRTELNLVSWNDGPVKYDLRPWDEKHEKCGKGATLTPEELHKLKDLLNEKIGGIQA